MVQTLIERKVLEVLHGPIGKIRNGTQGVAKSYQLFDADGGHIITLSYLEEKVDEVIGSVINDRTVASYTVNIDQDEEVRIRREEREEVFAATLDKMNPVWHSQLTDDQLAELETWRQTWLDYPETGLKPDDLAWLKT